MSNEKVTKLVKELQENAELREKVTSMSSPEEMLKFANDSGYDVTMEDLMEVDKTMREAQAQESDEVALTFDDVENVAGGTRIQSGDDASDGHEIGCVTSYHGYDWCEENNEWCYHNFYCNGGYYSKS